MPRRPRQPSLSPSSIAADDGQALIAAATGRRRRGPGKQGAPPSSPQQAAPTTSRRRAAAKRPVVESTTGQSTRSGSNPWAGGEDSDGERSWNVSRFSLLIVVITMLALSALAWRWAPPENNQSVLIPPQGVPRALFAEWVRGFPDSDRLFSRPDQATLEAFAAYLTSRTEVQRVDALYLRHADDAVESAGAARGPMQLHMDLLMHRPLLPVLLATGERAWLGEQGHLLSGHLNGPQGQPLVRGLEYSKRAVVEELVAIWPELSRGIGAFMPDLISEIRCDAPMPGSDDPGLVFVTRPGTVLTWGNPDEARYGVTREHRLRNLIHTLRCQGDLRRVPEINVRFHEPFAVVR